MRPDDRSLSSLGGGSSSGGPVEKKLLKNELIALVIVGIVQTSGLIVFNFIKTCSFSAISIISNELTKMTLVY